VKFPAMIAPEDCLVRCDAKETLNVILKKTRFDV
jgi:hypothetical protein